VHNILVLNNVQPSASGSYECIGTDNYGQSFSAISFIFICKLILVKSYCNIEVDMTLEIIGKMVIKPNKKAIVDL